MTDRGISTVLIKNDLLNIGIAEIMCAYQQIALSVSYVADFL